jgi:predicted phage tail protein
LAAGMATRSTLTVTEVDDQVRTDVMDHPLALRPGETETTLLNQVSASEYQVSISSRSSAPRFGVMRLKNRLEARGTSTHHHLCQQDMSCAF